MKVVHWAFRANEGQLDHLQGLSGPSRPQALSAFPPFRLSSVSADRVVIYYHSMYDTDDYSLAQQYLEGQRV